MINNIQIQGVKFTADKELQKYIAKKFGSLERYVPKKARESARIEVFLKESKIKAKKICECEVIMHLPGENIAIKDSTINMFAAVDIVEVTLKNRLKEYKEKHGNPALHRRLKARLRNIVRSKP